MAKAGRKPVFSDDYEVDSSTPDVAAMKMIGDVTNGISTINDFMEIPCDDLIIYQSKLNSDFHEWPEDKFKSLVKSIEDHGVIEPITVRPAKDFEGKYEILAGEHRWKGSIAAGKKTVPAHLLRDCDDQRAAAVFSLTNTLRRDTSVRDKINGWWHYVKMTRYKSSDEIRKMIAEGILPSDAEGEIPNMRQVYRYAICHDLPEEFLVLLDNQKLSIAAGDRIARMGADKVKQLVPYCQDIKNEGNAEKLSKLAKGDMPGLEWGEEGIRAILYPQSKKVGVTIKDVVKSAREVIKTRLDPAHYGDAEQILSDALDEYFEKHPEYRKKESKKGAAN